MPTRLDEWDEAERALFKEAGEFVNKLVLSTINSFVEDELEKLEAENVSSNE